MISFTVLGTPAPAGSKRGFYNPKAKRVIITDDSKRSRPWKALVSDAAAEAMNGDGLLGGPLLLKALFIVPRPKGHFGTGANAKFVRLSAPPYPTTKPDATKLLRAVEDAMTGIVYRDDAQIVVQEVRKLYGEPARCAIWVETIA